ncbi:Phosphatidylinositol-4-phosphate 5-kinase [Dissophora globulifera]|nr:Phosphatidylinositol-4-phosphate 5-kinase [Dissophora globulifera]
MTPPRISSLMVKNHTPSHTHSPPPSPPRLSCMAPEEHHPQPNGYSYTSKGHANGYEDIYAPEPSPTLSATETFPSSFISKGTSVSSPASSITSPAGTAFQPTPIDLTLATLTAGSPRPSTSSSTGSTPTSRPRPSSYAPTKVTDVSLTLANMSTMVSMPISSSIIISSPPSPTEQTQRQQPAVEPDAKRSPRPAIPGVVGAGGGYQSSQKSSSPGFAPPTRASTMDYRKTPSSSLLTDSPASGISRQQQQQQYQQQYQQQQQQQQQQLDSVAESSVRPRRKQIYRRNTYSAELASTSFHRSDDELELDDQEEARRRMDALKKSSSRRMSKRKKDDDNDRVMIGTRIGEDHVNYVLMYNMLTGIRVSVSRCQAKPQRPLVDEDFTSAHKLAFDITGNELTPSSKYDFKFKDYAPWVFRNLREDFHIDASDYLVSLTSKYILSELGSPGKSGSFFYFSQDYRFIIKTIHHAEHKFMRKILKDYFNHVKQNPHTLLCRFFGLHRVKLPHGRKIHFVVMGNVFPPNRDIHETYDLKGSTLGRAISDEELESNPRATQKDLNWVNRNRKLELGPERRHLFVEQTKRDVQLLARLNIMDYSLLIGIHDIERGNKDNIRDNTLKVFNPDATKQMAREPSRRDKRESKVNALRAAVKESDPVALGPSALPSDSFSERRHCIFYADDGGLLSTNELNERGEDLYYLGIIDILTPYNYVKKVEHYWKSMSQDKHAISSVNPKEYAQRFLSFMIHAIKINHDVMPTLDQRAHPHSE